MNDDQQLIQEYVESQSQEAFSRLVSRYIRLVWATASRVTQSSLNADDITQETFLLLAKKARRLSQSTDLSGWLHRTTYLLALNQRRSDHRRATYHKEANQIMLVDSTSHSPDSWREIAPELDACIESLSERERSFLFLRFFRNLKWSQVDHYHQISEGAAKMQVQRSLQKLRHQLQQSGVAVSLLSLGSLLHANVAPPLEADTLSRISHVLSEAVTRQRRPLNLLPTRVGPLAIASVLSLVSLVFWFRGSLERQSDDDSLLGETNGARVEGESVNGSDQDWLNGKLFTRNETSATQALRDAIYNRDLLSEPSRKGVEAALKLFGADGARAVPVLLDALLEPLDSMKGGRTVSDTYFVGKEHFLALHGLRVLGPSARSATGVLLERINQDYVYLHHRYPQTIRALDPDPSIVPALARLSRFARIVIFFRRNFS